MKIVSNISTKVMEFKNKYNNLKKPALAKMGLQLLDNIVNGSPYESAVPPKDMGVLRGSGSVFVGNELIGVSPLVNGEGTPNLNHSEANENVITIGFNTAYAAAQHENHAPFGKQWQDGRISEQSGDVSGKYLELHLYNDREAAELINVFGKELQEDLFK